MAAIFVWIGVVTLERAPLPFSIAWFTIIGMTALLSSVMVAIGVWLMRHYRGKLFPPVSGA